MLAVAIVISILLILTFLRLGIIVVYDESGLTYWLKVGFIKISILTEEKKKRKQKMEWKRKRKLNDVKPGSLKEFLNILKVIKEILGRLKRKLLIKKIVILYTCASDDPAKTALHFGAVSAVFAVIVPALEKHFRIKKRDLRAAADFESTEAGLYLKLSASIAVWESVYVIWALTPILTQKKVVSETTVGNKRKDGQSDGKATDK